MSCYWKAGVYARSSPDKLLTGPADDLSVGKVPAYYGRRREAALGIAAPDRQQYLYALRIYPIGSGSLREGRSANVVAEKVFVATLHQDQRVGIGGMGRVTKFVGDELVRICSAQEHAAIEWLACLHTVRRTQLTGHPSQGLAGIIDRQENLLIGLVVD